MELNKNIKIDIKDKRLNKNSNKESGITLIALIITIIVLLILAGVALASITGENGLLVKSSQAKEEALKAQIKEEIEIAIMDIQAKEASEGRNVTLASLAGEDENGQLENHEDLQKGNITADLGDNEVTGKYKGYNYKIDSNLEVIIEDYLSYEEYIKNHKNIDKIIYVDSKTGNDETGNGTQNNAYKTLDKISQEGVIEQDKTYAFILMDGEYTLTTKLFELNCNESINIFGNKQNTILNVESLYANTGTGGSRNYSVNFYRLVFNATKPVTNAICLNTNITFRNVVFNVAFDAASYGYFCTENSTFEFINCTLPKKVTNFLRSCSGWDKTPHGYIYLTNCYGGFQQSEWGINSDWNYKTNYITSTPKVNSSTYRITDEQSVWKNKGTGTDPDKSPADLGVYGGEYSWDSN